MIHVCASIARPNSMLILSVQLILISFSPFGITGVIRHVQVTAGRLTYHDTDVILRKCPTASAPTPFPADLSLSSCFPGLSVAPADFPCLLPVAAVLEPRADLPAHALH